MRRTRLIDLRLSKLPSLLGICVGDINQLAQEVNAAQERLLYAKEANEEGWSGGWAEMVFSVDRRKPYITCPRGVARLEAIDVCGQPVPLQNQFYEYLLFGNGRMPKEGLERGGWWGRGWRMSQGFARNNAVTFNDLTDGPQQIQIYCASSADVGKRVFIQGIGANGSQVYTQDGNSNVMGEFVTLAQPFASTVNEYLELTGIQKDITVGEVQIFQMDTIWGIQELLSVMEPTETTGWYRRYYLDRLPHGCCPWRGGYRPGTSPDECGCPSRRRERVLVTALAKLDLVPVVGDTDYTLIQSVEALIHECQAGRNYGFDDATAQTSSAGNHHLQAIRLLIGELQHTQGKNMPATSFRPFGSADLRKVGLGMI